MPEKWIKVIAVPPGGAPFEIRQSWVGLRLPLAHTLAFLEGDYPDDSEIYRQLGILPEDVATGEPTNENAGGYIIKAAAAIQALLSAGETDAAAYWIRNLSRAYESYAQAVLVFAREVCEPVEGR
jgi:nitroreductase